MKVFLLIVCLLGFAVAQSDWRENHLVDVPAIAVSVPAPFPCNLPGPSPTACITGPETHWKCADTSRVLLMSGNGKRHCINFATIQERLSKDGTP